MQSYKLLLQQSQLRKIRMNGKTKVYGYRPSAQCKIRSSNVKLISVPFGLIQTTTTGHDTFMIIVHNLYGINITVIDLVMPHLYGCSSYVKFTAMNKRKCISDNTKLCGFQHMKMIYWHFNNVTIFINNLLVNNYKTQIPIILNIFYQVMKKGFIESKMETSVYEAPYFKYFTLVWSTTKSQTFHWLVQVDMLHSAYLQIQRWHSRNQILHYLLSVFDGPSHVFQIIRNVVSTEPCNISCSIFQCYILLSYESIAAVVRTSFMMVVSKRNIVPNRIHLYESSAYVHQSINIINITKQIVYNFVSNPHIFVSIQIYSYNQIFYDAVRCIYGDATVLEQINGTIYTRFDACHQHNYPKIRDFQVISSGNSMFVVIYFYENFPVKVDITVKTTKTVGIFLNPYSYPYIEVYKPLYLVLYKEYSYMGDYFQSVYIHRHPNLTVVLQFLGAMIYFDPKGISRNIDIYLSGTYGHYRFRSRIKFLYQSYRSPEPNAIKLYKNHVQYSDIIRTIIAISQTLPCEIPCFQHLQSSIPGILIQCDDCVGKYNIYNYSSCNHAKYTAGCNANSTTIFSFHTCTNMCKIKFIISIQPRERYVGVANRIVLNNLYHGKILKLYVFEKSYIQTTFVASYIPDLARVIAV